ncbi:MAG: phosphate ABC transporter permease PstA [Alphaproteobacteria bacterium]
MSDLAAGAARTKSDLLQAGLQKRYRAEKRFRLYGLAAIATALGMLAWLFGSILLQGLPTLTQTQIALDVVFDAEIIDPEGSGDATVLARADYTKLARNALRARFADVSGRRDKRALAKLISVGAEDDLRRAVLEDPTLIGRTARIWLTAGADMDALNKGTLGREGRQEDRRLSDKQIGWFDELAAEGNVRRAFNSRFFTAGDSREPELAGIRGATIGTFYVLFVTLLLSFPTGVMAAVYLEEFAPQNRWTEIVEVNINNLAAVPSIVFGLLGLAVFLNVFGLPRSAPLVGGMVLALMTLPTIIIAARASLKAVPPSIRDAALAIGASPMQTVTHHVLPLAMPGILTGTIIGMARALGESAPLLMIGMVAFVADIPRGASDPATVLPVQVFLWADAPERSFAERTAATILVLLAVLVAMNLSAVILRKKFERRW